MDDLTAPTGREEALRALPREDGSEPRALVLGATGYLGGRLVPRLLNGGYRVRVLARDARRVAAFDWGDKVEVVEGDATDPDAVGEAVRDVDVLYYLVHSMGAGKGFESADRAAATTVAEAAAAASVGRIVYLGGLHPDDVELSPHLRSRVEVGQILLDSGVPTLVLQAGVVIGSGSASFEMVRHLTEVLPYMPAPKWVRNRIQPIAVRDVLHYLLGAARVDADVNTRRRHRRTRRAALRPDDERLRRRGGAQAARHRRAAGAHPAARVALGEPRDADPAARGDAARRVAAERVRREEPRRRRAHPAPRRRTDAVPPCRRPRARQGQARRDRDELAGRRSARRAERPAAERPRLGRQDRVHRPAHRAHRRLARKRSGASCRASAANAGWYSNPLLWAMRGWMDKLVGGVGPAPRSPSPRPARRRRRGRLLARRGARAGVAPAPARRDEGARSRVARDARRRRRRRARATTSGPSSSRAGSPVACTGSPCCRSTASSSRAWRTASPRRPRRRMPTPRLPRRTPSPPEPGLRARRARARAALRGRSCRPAR